MRLGLGVLSIGGLVPSLKARQDGGQGFLCSHALKEATLFKNKNKNYIPTHCSVALCPETHVPALLGTTGQIMTCTSVL